MAFGSASQYFINACRTLLNQIFQSTYLFIQLTFRNQYVDSQKFVPLYSYYHYLCNLTIIFKSSNKGLSISNMHSHQTLYIDNPKRSRGKIHKQTTNKDFIDQQEDEYDINQLKTQNTKLKKMLKQAQSKRTQITKECSQLTNTIQRLEHQNKELKHRVKEEQEKCDGEKYRWQELKFLNKQLSSQIESLRSQNDSLTQKLRYSSQILERKYEELEEKSYKRMQQCVKRVKKTINYLQTLSVKEIDKTREMLVENLRKSIELLRGKYYEQMNCEGEIQQLMNPLKTMQEEISQKTKELNHYKQENLRLTQEITKYKSMEKDQIPMFKQAIEKFKKNLVQLRQQLSENEYEKMQIKKRYEQKLRQSEYKYKEIFKQCRKIKLQKKIYENKLAELEADVQEQKERLIGENQMLKKLYHNQDSSESRISQLSNSRGYPFSKDKKTQQKRVIKKNYSSNELKTSNINLKNSVSDYQIGDKVGEVSEYNQQSSMLSQQNLKQEICRIDEQIMQIQKNLTKQLQAYR